MAKTWNLDRLNAADPAGDVACVAVGHSSGDGIAIVDEAGFAFREDVDGAQSDPGFVLLIALERGAEQIAEHGDSEHRTDGAVERERRA